MALTALGVYQDIINEPYNKSVHVAAKHYVHQVHEYNKGISQPKWHDKELVMTVMRYERRLWNILKLDPQLMIS